MGALPRTLADDLMLLSMGSKALHTFRYAFTATLEYLTALGGKLSAHKSRLFSTVETHRKWLAAYIWPVVQQQIQVTLKSRDLGAALSFARTACTYSAMRIRAGIAALFAIRRLPFDRIHKAQFSLAAAHTKSFYSCEASQVDQTSLKKFTSVLLQTVGTNNQMQARTLILGCSAPRAEIHPVIYILIKKVTMFRRFLIKYPAKIQRVATILQAYSKQRYVGALSEEVRLEDLTPAPLPGQDERYKWNASSMPSGPVLGSCCKMFTTSVQRMTAIIILFRRTTPRPCISSTCPYN